MMNNELRRVAARPCTIEGCDGVASWEKDGDALCGECMEFMSDMNSDNAEFFAPALIYLGLYADRPVPIPVPEENVGDERKGS